MQKNFTVTEAGSNLVRGNRLYPGETHDRSQASNRPSLVLYLFEIFTKRKSSSGSHNQPRAQLITVSTIIKNS